MRLGRPRSRPNTLLKIQGEDADKWTSDFMISSYSANEAMILAINNKEVYMLVIMVYYYINATLKTSYCT